MKSISPIEFSGGPPVTIQLCHIKEAFYIILHTILFLRAVGVPLELNRVDSLKLQIPYFHESSFDSFVEKECNKYMKHVEAQLQLSDLTFHKTFVYQEEIIFKYSAPDEHKKGPLWGGKLLNFECWKIKFEILIPEDPDLRIKKLKNPDFLTQGLSLVEKIVVATAAKTMLLTKESSFKYPHRGLPMPVTSSKQFSDLALTAKSSESSSTINNDYDASIFELHQLCSRIDETRVEDSLEERSRNSIIALLQWLSHESVNVEHVPAVGYFENNQSSSALNLLCGAVHYIEIEYQYNISMIEKVKTKWTKVVEGFTSQLS